MIGLLAELEHSLITERTRTGITAARKRGVKFGCKPKLDAEQLKHAREMLDQGKDRQHVARLLKVSRTALYRALAAN
jgi:DNA invertase Pin-like site-specific DNA recombinase